MPAVGALLQRKPCQTLIHAPKISAWPGNVNNGINLENINQIVGCYICSCTEIGCSRLGDMPSNSFSAKLRRRLKDTAFRPGKIR